MKKPCWVLSLSIIVLFGTISICNAVKYHVTQIYNGSYGSGRLPWINDNGYVVWYAAGEIYLYNGTSVTNISNSPSVEDTDPQIGDNGHVFWTGDDGSDQDIYRYDGISVANISNSPSVRDRFYGIYRQVNDNGWVVWEGMTDSADFEIFLYDGTSVTNISNNPSGHDYYPCINNDGQVVWCGDVAGNNEIFLYNGTSVTNVSNSPSVSEWEPKINNNGQLAWSGYDGTSYETYFYDGTSVINISNNPSGSDVLPRINDNGLVVWRGGAGSNDDIYLYDGFNVKNISNNPGQYSSPDINENGHVVWRRGGSDLDIYLYDGTNVSNISNSQYSPGFTNINNNGQVVWSDVGIFLAEPVPSATASSKDLTVTIPGSKCFSISIDNPGPNDFTVTPSINWTQAAPADVTFTGGSVSVSAGGSQFVSIPCFSVGSQAQQGSYNFDILWTGIDSGGNPVEVTTDPTLHLVHPSGPTGATVGGTAFMADKSALLAPWIALGVLILLGLGVIAIRKYRKNLYK